MYTVYIYIMFFFRKNLALRPDFYGPFWVATTAVLFLAVGALEKMTGDREDEGKCSLVFPLLISFVMKEEGFHTVLPCVQHDTSGHWQLCPPVGDAGVGWFGGQMYEVMRIDHKQKMFAEWKG